MSESIGLLTAVTASSVSLIDTDRVEEWLTGKVLRAFHSLQSPAKAFDQFKDIARARGLFPRDLFSEALRRLLQDRQAGTEVTYLASRKGGVRRSLWLEDDLVEAMDAAAEADNVSKTEFFLTALRRFAEREGIDAEV